jgi:hypothetical protein
MAWGERNTGWWAKARSSSPSIFPRLPDKDQLEVD